MKIVFLNNLHDVQVHNKFSSLQEAILKFILEKKKEYEKKLAEYEKAGSGHKLIFYIGITSRHTVFIGSVVLFL